MQGMSVLVVLVCHISSMPWACSLELGLTKTIRMGKSYANVLAVGSNTDGTWQQHSTNL